MSRTIRYVVPVLVVGLAAGFGLVGAPVQALPSSDRSPIPGFALPVGVRDVSDAKSMSRTPAVADEVVVGVTHGSKLRIVTLEAGSPTQAAELVRTLDGRPGITAEINQKFQLAAPQARSGVGALRVPAIAGEEYGVALWGLDAIHAEAAWAVTRGESVVVAVVDSGVDETHPELAGRVLPQIDLVPDEAGSDPAGHGTMVAGIIAAASDGKGVVGVAPGAIILPVRVLNEYGSSYGDWMARGIVAAADAGALVINLSLGGTEKSKVDQQAIRYAADKGVTIVAAVGNEYDQGNPTEYPAAFPDAIAVGSIGGNDDGSFYSAAYSNAGTYVDIAAPGDEILSLAPTWADDIYTTGDGTSFASPHVAGVAALVRAANPGLNKQAVDEILLGTASDLGEAQGWDPDFGQGLVQADQAVVAAQSGAPAKVAIKAYPVNRASNLFVDVDPDLGPGYFDLTVQKQAPDGTWVNFSGPLQTKTDGETRKIKLKKGVYRVFTAAGSGFAENTSGPVTIRR